MRYDAASDKYVPVSWDEAFKLAGRHFHGLDNPNLIAAFCLASIGPPTAFCWLITGRIV
jgi:anaerobic selenocysteine-containing dehydrogenase